MPKIEINYEDDSSNIRIRESVGHCEVDGKKYYLNITLGGGLTIESEGKSFTIKPQSIVAAFLPKFQ